MYSTCHIVGELVTGCSSARLLHPRYSNRKRDQTAPGCCRSIAGRRYSQSTTSFAGPKKNDRSVLAQREAKLGDAGEAAPSSRPRTRLARSHQRRASLSSSLLLKPEGQIDVQPAIGFGKRSASESSYHIYTLYDSRWTLLRSHQEPRRRIKISHTTFPYQYTIPLQKESKKTKYQYHTSKASALRGSTAKKMWGSREAS